MLPELTQAGALRVFMTADAVGGVWQYSLDLAQGLRAYDTETTLCVLGPKPQPEQLAAARRIPGIRSFISISRSTDGFEPEAVLDAAATLVMRRRRRKQRVHLNSPLGGGSAVSCPGRDGLSLVHGHLVAVGTQKAAFETVPLAQGPRCARPGQSRRHRCSEPCLRARRGRGLQPPGPAYGGLQRAQALRAGAVAGERRRYTRDTVCVYGRAPFGMKAEPGHWIERLHAPSGSRAGP